MKKKIVVMALLCLSFANVWAQQNEKIAALMEEREQLVMEYQFYNQQNSNFWGKKSKGDLLTIIETLKKIINQDSELINAVKAAGVKKIAESTVESQRSGKLIMVDQRQINDRIAGLQSQINALETQVKKRERTIKDMEGEVNAADEKRYGKDRVIAILAIAVFGMFVYAAFLQVKLNHKAPKAKRKTK